MNQIETLIQRAANAIEVSLTILSSSSTTESHIEAVDTIAEAVSNLLDILPTTNTGDFNSPETCANAESALVSRVIHDLNRRLYEMISSRSTNSVDTAVDISVNVMMVIDCLIDVLPAKDGRLPDSSRYVSYIHSMLPSSDRQLLHDVGNAMGKLVKSNHYAAQLIDSEVPACIDTLLSIQNAESQACTSHQADTLGLTSLCILSSILRNAPGHLTRAYIPSIMHAIWSFFRTDILSDMTAVLDVINAIFVQLYRKCQSFDDFRSECEEYMQRAYEEAMFIFHRGKSIEIGVALLQAVLGSKNVEVDAIEPATMNKVTFPSLIKLLPTITSELFHPRVLSTGDTKILSLVRDLILYGPDSDWFVPFLPSWFDFLMETASVEHALRLIALEFTLGNVSADQKLVPRILFFLINSYKTYPDSAISCLATLIERFLEFPKSLSIIFSAREMIRWLFDEQHTTSLDTKIPFSNSFQRLYLAIRAVYLKEASRRPNQSLLLDHKLLSLLDAHATRSRDFDIPSKQTVIDLLEQIDIKPQLNPVTRPFCRKVLIPLWTCDETESVRIGAVRLALCWIALHPCKEVISVLNLLLDTLIGFRNECEVRKTTHSDTIEVLMKFLASDHRLDPLLARSPRAITLLHSLAANFKGDFFSRNDPRDIIPHGIDHQKLAMTCHSRLAAFDPASFLPKFRRGLMRCLADVESWTAADASSLGLLRVTAGGNMLIHYLDYPPSFVCPYTDAAMLSIIRKLKDLRRLLHSSSTHSHLSDLEFKFLRAVERVAKVNDKGLMPYLDDLIELLISGIQDSSSQARRLICLDTLDTIVCLIDRQRISVDFMANLWFSVAELLKFEQVAPVRKKLIKLLGSIGAIDPYRMQAIEFNLGRLRAGITVPLGNKLKPVNAHLQHRLADPVHSPTQINPVDSPKSSKAADASSDEADNNDTISGNHGDRQRHSALLSEDIYAIISVSGGISSDDCYPMVALWAVLRVLKEGTLANHHITALTATVSILEAIYPRFPRHGLLSALFPCLINLLRNSDNPSNTIISTTTNSTLSLIQHVTSIVRIVKAHLRPYAHELLDIVANRLVSIWTTFSEHSPPLNHFLIQAQALLELVLAVLDMLSDDVHQLSSLLLPSIILSLNNPVKCESVIIVSLRIVCMIGPAISEHSHIFMDTLTTLLQSTQSTHLHMICLDTILTLTHSLDLAEFLPILVPIFCTPAFSADAPRSLCLYILRQLISSSGEHSIVWSPIIQDLGFTIDVKSNYSLTFSPEPRAINIDPGSLVISSPQPPTSDNKTSPSDSVVLSTIMQLPSLWSGNSCSNNTDWFQWIRSFSLALLEHSPCLPLRALHAVALENVLVAKEVFNIAFVAAFDGLKEGEEVDELIGSIETAFASSSTPPEILQQLLNLAEFLEHEERPLPIDIHTLGAYAYKCHAFAKALYYKELEFKTLLHQRQQSGSESEHAASNKAKLPDDSFATSIAHHSAIESLISINHQMQQPDAAIGLLEYAQHAHGLVLQGVWYEKLNRWDDALREYEKRLQDANRLEYNLLRHSTRIQDQEACIRDDSNASPFSSSIAFDALLGVFRCRNALGHWHLVTEMANTLWPRIDDNLQAAIAPLAAASSWSTLDWQSMQKFTKAVSIASTDGMLFRAVLAVRDGDAVTARTLIDRTRELVDTELTALIGESYTRAYRTIVRVHMMNELEEAIEYLQSQPCEEFPLLNGQTSHQQTQVPMNCSVPRSREQIRIARTWYSRLLQCQEGVEVWQRILKVRALAISPRTSIDLTSKFARLCQKSGRGLLARRCFLYLLGIDETGIDNLMQPFGHSDTNYYHEHTTTTTDMDTTFVPDPSVMYALLKHIWSSGEHDRAIVLMRRLIRHLTMTVNSDASVSNRLARCHYRMACWLRHSQENRSVLGSDDDLSDQAPSSSSGPLESTLLDHYLAAVSYDQQWHKAWHGLALANQAMIISFEHNRSLEARPRSNPYIIPSIQSLFKAIALSANRRSGALQDTLRLLTLWFKFGGLPEVNGAISDGFYSIPIDCWLHVAPQLIARIHVPNPQVRRLIHHVLTDIGKQYPQALIMQITVASKSPSMSRRTAALTLLDKFRSHSVNLVDQVKRQS